MQCPQCGVENKPTKPGGIWFCNMSSYARCYYASHLEEIMSDRDPLLQEREKTHGSFQQNALLSQKLKDIFYAGGRRNAGYRDEHLEALDMIALKLSRILSGQANYRDHWDDIAGYAKLASEACDRS